MYAAGYTDVEVERGDSVVGKGLLDGVLESEQDLGKQKRREHAQWNGRESYVWEHSLAPSLDQSPVPGTGS